MTIPSLADSLKIILPHFSPKITTLGALSRLQKVAKLSLPTPRAGFEICLDRENDQLDLQLGVSSQDNEPKLLAEYITALNSSPHELERYSWSRLHKFCEAWSDSNSCFHSTISEIWLEFDINESTQLLIPSIFIGISRDITDLEQAFNVTKLAIEMLWNKSINDNLYSNLHRCFANCKTPARISYVGIMLSRQIEALRINVSSLSPNQITFYLQEIGYSESTNEIETLVLQLLDIVDDVRVCLDIGAAVYPQVGLECSFRQQHGLEPLWFTLLDYLVERGLCTPEKREGLLSWPGHITPVFSSLSWSTHLTPESLVQPLNILERGLSHIKITHKPQRPLEAKAYLGFVHQSLGKSSAEDNKQAQNPINFSNSTFSTKAEELDPNRLNSAIQTATCFLIDARNQKGWWRDFCIYKQRSDEWVTAYIGAVLAVLPDEQAKLAARQAWFLLLNRRQSEPAWGYNPVFSPDFDSTAWTLRLAGALDEMKSQKAQIAAQFIVKHISPTGGISTYLEELAPLVYGDSVSVKGWCSVHACVTAAVAGLEGIGKASLDFLKNTQHDDGSWKAYWWYDHEYATALAAEALARDCYQRNYRQLKLAIEWATERISPSGAVYSHQYANNSAFATALCVRTLALSKEQHQIQTSLHKAVNWLLDTQKLDGSWESSALLRLPKSPDIIDPDNHPSQAFPDDRRLFTTATVLAALSAVTAHCR
jgi:hypothetical protein